MESLKLSDKKISISTMIRGVTRKAVYAWAITLLLVIGQGKCDSCKMAQVGEHKSCQCTTEGGFLIDLSPIVDTVPQRPVFKDQETLDTSKDSAKYSYQPCVPFTEENCANVAACQIADQAASSHYSLGTPNSAVFTGDPSKNELNLTYSGDESRKLYVKLRCSKEKGSLEVLGETQTGSKDYEFILHTKYVCMPSSSLSVGSILMIIFFVLVFIYLVGGILILRYQHGARGLEQIPNYDFWMEFPGLIKDGFLFVKNGCKGDTGYSQI